MRAHDAVARTCSWVEGHKNVSLKRAGILGPVARLPHFIDVLLLAGAMADDACVFTRDLMEKSRDKAKRSKDKAKAGAKGGRRRRSTDPPKEQATLMFGHQRDHFMRALMGMDEEEGGKRRGYDVVLGLPRRRGGLRNEQAVREARLEDGGGVSVVATACLKVTTKVVQWLEEVARTPSNAKYRDIGLIENYTFLHHAVAKRGLKCLVDFTALCEQRAQAHAEAYLDWSLSYEFPNLIKFWKQVEDVALSRGMADVADQVPLAKYQRMRSEHPSKKINAGLREVHGRLAKHCTAEDGFSRAHLWRQLVDKILTSWTRWEELASVCYHDQRFQPSSQQVHQWLLIIK
mmetsp:Transcript_11592/g.35205  ORF Transcript_11592/g.35205 Transcript_11592/m.35205 type:complete len:346 (-) Transcript_11592:83-1120(-)